MDFEQQLRRELRQLADESSNRSDVDPQIVARAARRARNNIALAVLAALAVVLFSLIMVVPDDSLTEDELNERIADGQREAPTSQGPPSGADETGQILYVSGGPGVGFGQIFLRLDADETRQLTTSELGEYGPSWSADGEKIAFTSQRDGNSEIYVMDADGSNQTRLTTDPSDGEPQLQTDVQPSWSPDSTHIAFTSYRERQGDIWVMREDGSGIKPLTTDEALDSSPVWSPLGTKIAFSSVRNGPPEVFVMNADGSDQTPIADGDAPEWSPNGMRIAFVRGNELVIAQSNGTNKQVVVTREVASGSHLSWSPDGSAIAYSSNRNGSLDLFSVILATEESIVIADGPGDEADPAWSPLSSPGAQSGQSDERIPPAERLQERREIPVAGVILLPPRPEDRATVSAEEALSLAQDEASSYGEPSSIVRKLALYTNEHHKKQAPGASPHDRPTELVHVNVLVWFVTFDSICVLSHGPGFMPEELGEEVTPEPQEEPKCAGTEVNVVLNAETGKQISTFSYR